MRQDKNEQLMKEELESAKGNPEKNMILQKYGLKEPWITAQEEADIKMESAGMVGTYAWVKDWQPCEFIFTPVKEIIYGTPS